MDHLNYFAKGGLTAYKKSGIIMYN